jgi:hypothetical protein
MKDSYGYDENVFTYSEPETPTSFIISKHDEKVLNEIDSDYIKMTETDMIERLLRSKNSIIEDCDTFAQIRTKKFSTPKGTITIKYRHNNTLCKYDINDPHIMYGKQILLIEHTESYNLNWTTDPQIEGYRVSKEFPNPTLLIKFKNECSLELEDKIRQPGLLSWEPRKGPPKFMLKGSAIGKGNVSFKRKGYERLPASRSSNLYYKRRHLKA